jgi:hypothetical protein
MPEMDTRVLIAFMVQKKEDVSCPVNIGGIPIYTAQGNGEFPGVVMHLTEDQEGRPCVVAAVMHDPSRIVAYMLSVVEIAHMLSHEFKNDAQPVGALVDGNEHTLHVCPDLPNAGAIVSRT